MSGTHPRSRIRPQSRHPRAATSSLHAAVEGLGYGGVSSLRQRGVGLDDFTRDLDRSIFDDNHKEDIAQRSSRANPNKPNYKMRRLAATVLLFISGMVAKEGVDATAAYFHGVQEDNRLYEQTTKPDAMQRYLDGKIDPTKVVIVSASENSTASQFAEELHPEGDYRKLSDELHGQSDANGIPGVQKGEEFVVPKSDVQIFSSSE